MNSESYLLLNDRLEKLASGPTGVGKLTSAVKNAGDSFFDRVSGIVHDPVVQAGMLIGAGSGVASAARDYVPLDPTDPRARGELKRRIGIGVTSGLLLGIGASHGMKAVSKQIAEDLTKRSPEMGEGLGVGLWNKMKFWKRKSAEAEIDREEHETSRLNKGHASQLGKNLAVIGISSALGGGAGYGLGRLLKKHYPDARSSTAFITAMGAATGLAIPLIKQYRDTIATERMNQAGLDHSKRIAEKRKVARILAGPQEWNEDEHSTITTSGKGALAGLGAAGIAGLTTGKFPLGYGLVGGALAGGYLGHRKYKKALEAQQQQYEGQ